MLALPKKREQRTHWQHACRLLLQQAGVAALTRQVHLALFMDGKLDVGAFEHMSSARRHWPSHDDTLTGTSSAADRARQDDTRSRNLWSAFRGQ
jgi:hypothetical protein